MREKSLTAVRSIQEARRGLFACVIVALSAAFLADQYRMPILLVALLLGMASAFVVEHPGSRAGVDLASGTILRVGVALLGFRVLAGDVITLGWSTMAMLAGAAAVTIAGGMVLARLLKLDGKLGALSGGAVAICGVSAAIAISAVMPRSRAMDQYLAVTVVTVTVFGSVAMILYPVLVQAVGLDPLHAGIFLGASIHDVSHVVGAGYSVSPSVGDFAVLVKMVRVVLLVPVVWAFHALFRSDLHREPGSPKLTLPWFLIGFVLVAAISSLGFVPDSVRQLSDRLSQGCLLVAMVAIGMKTSVSALLATGWRSVLLVLGESLLIGALALAWCVF